MASGPRTIVVNVDTPSQSVSFQLPPNVSLDVQSVYAEIDATAGVAVPELSIAEQSGQVIATKRQNKTIGPGDTGSATWALRLDDEQAAAVDPFLPVLAVYVALDAGQPIANNTLGVIAFDSVKYDHGGWINLGVDPKTLTVPATGYYTAWAQFDWPTAAAAGQRREVNFNLQGDPFRVGEVARSQVPTIAALPPVQSLSLTRRLVAGSTLQAIVVQNSGGTISSGTVHMAVTRVWKG